MTHHFTSTLRVRRNRTLLGQNRRARASRAGIPAPAKSIVKSNAKRLFLVNPSIDCAAEPTYVSPSHSCCRMTGNRLILPQGHDREGFRVGPLFRAYSVWTPYIRMNLSQESFDRLLAWLHPNREEAGLIYERIRSRLIRGFTAHHCLLPEKLADDTIDRVARKLAEIGETYVGQPDPYFFRVAYYVHLEYLANNPQVVELPDDLISPDAAEEVELELTCLEQCLKVLPPSKRHLIETYYRGEKRTKITTRKELAFSLNVGLPALRLKAQRIRKALKKCIKECLLGSGRLNEPIRN